MSLEPSAIIAFAVGLIALYVIGLLLVIPIKIIVKLMINGLIGGVILLLVNFIGGFAGLALGINPVTAIIAGLLGLPGIIMLLIVQSIT